MHILVTGGSGFIGTNLCIRLIKEGHKVLCIDNFSSSIKQNIESLMDHGTFHFLEADISLSSIINLVKNKCAEKIDRIYHLACPASPIHYQKDPIQTMDTCYL